MSLAAAVVVATTWLQYGSQRSDALETVTLRFLITSIAAGLVCLVIIALGVRKLLNPLHRLRESMLDTAEGRPLQTDTLPRSCDLLAVREAYQKLARRIRDVQR